MAGTVGEEEIVEGNEEIGGRKRVSTDKDAHPAKRAQLEGNEAAALIVDDKVEGGGEEEREEEREEEKEEPKEKIDRLRGLLEDDPKKLGHRDVEDVICYLDVDEIISLALKSDQGNGSEQRWVAEVEKWTLDEGVRKKVAGVVRTMLCYVEIVKRAEFRLLYEKFPPQVFTTLLLAAMDANYVRRSGGGPPLIKAEERGIIPKLCCVLPWKLFAHVLNEKGWVPCFDGEPDEEEEEGEEATLVQKQAAENCDVCLGKGRHTGSFGGHCSFKDAVPTGATVGTKYSVVCSYCGDSSFKDYGEQCIDCGCKVGRAVRIPSRFLVSTHK